MHLFKELLTKTEFDALASDEVAESLLKTHHNYYEFGDKPSKILAHQIQQSVSPQQITQLNITDGLTTSPKSINDQFRDFYSLLYTSESSSGETQYKTSLGP